MQSSRVSAWIVRASLVKRFVRISELKLQTKVQRCRPPTKDHLAPSSIAESPEYEAAEAAKERAPQSPPSEITIAEPPQVAHPSVDGGDVPDLSLTGKRRANTNKHTKGRAAKLTLVWLAQRWVWYNICATCRRVSPSQCSLVWEKLLAGRSPAVDGPAPRPGAPG